MVDSSTGAGNIKEETKTSFSAKKEESSGDRRRKKMLSVWGKSNGSKNQKKELPMDKAVMI